VTVEQYLRGVVPNEVPASWPEAVLEAQAVAARSYVLAGDGRWGSHADTCDNTYCQVYDGRVTSRGGSRVATHSRTDAAIVATKGQVRLTASGRVARTEFSSSTGGHTAGFDFTAVEDLGDATSANPNSSWSTTVGLTGLINRYGLGPVKSIEVTERDGHGRFGGRAEEVTIVFRDGTRTMSGSAVRRFFGLKSDLFDFAAIQFGPTADPVVKDPAPPVNEAAAPTEPAEPEEPVAEDEPAAEMTDYKPVVAAMFEQLVDRDPDQSELETWSEAMARDEGEARRRLAEELVADDAFAGKLIADLYQSTFDRDPDPEGGLYWVGRLTATGRAHLTYEEIGTNLFGSTEYYRRSGGSHTGFVKNLYRDLLGRQADAAGLDYWHGILDSGSTEDVVTWFYRSDESRRDRAAALYRLAIGQEPTGSQVKDGAELLVELSDLELAALYGADINP
jgi:SpoIID/LytB domain protein